MYKNLPTMKSEVANYTCSDLQATYNGLSSEYQKEWLRRAKNGGVVRTMSAQGSATDIQINVYDPDPPHPYTYCNWVATKP